MILALFLLLFPINASLSSLSPMKIAVVSGYGSLDSDMQTELQNSLKWFQNAFLIQKLPSTEPPKLEDVFERIPEYRKFSSVLVQTPVMRQNMKLQDLNQLLEVADFSVFIVAQDPRRCARDRDLLAEAMPIVLVPDTRPPLAVMSMCLRNNPNLPNRFFFDLFRHEILHGLGYGMMIDKSSETIKPSEKYVWHHANGLGHPETRHFLDFDEFALKKARAHFGCDTMKGLEADGERKNHLNEYIFGNELMTTHLEQAGNVFSWISVGIIERTFNGKDQWYHINRTFIAPEASQYTYGRGFGCEFLEKSCHEFIRHVENLKPNLDIAPFCSKNTCIKQPGTNGQLRKLSAQDCEIRKLASVNHDLTTDNNKNQHGKQQRQCPMIINNHLLMKNYQFVQCPPPPGG